MTDRPGLRRAALRPPPTGTAALLLLSSILAGPACDQCTDPPYIPSGTKVGSAEECPTGTCPLQCGLDIDTCLEDAIYCEDCPTLFRYAVEECDHCDLRVAYDGTLIELTCVNGPL